MEGQLQKAVRDVLHVRKPLQTGYKDIMINSILGLANMNNRNNGSMNEREVVVYVCTC